MMKFVIHMKKIMGLQRQPKRFRGLYWFNLQVHFFTFTFQCSGGHFQDDMKGSTFLLEHRCKRLTLLSVLTMLHVSRDVTFVMLYMYVMTAIHSLCNSQMEVQYRVYFLSCYGYNNSFLSSILFSMHKHFGTHWQNYFADTTNHVHRLWFTTG
jgi:hypothetical protein